MLALQKIKQSSSKDREAIKQRIAELRSSGDLTAKESEALIAELAKMS